MAKYSSHGSRVSTIFFRHKGAETRDVHLRVNPQAIRVQQANKGSVVDTLGGYFREIMFAEDAQHNGLMLPDLTIECETGAGYRKELQKLQWIWRNHGTAKADGTPADTYFMDFTDEDILWSNGGAAAGGKGGNAGQKGVQRNVPLGQAPIELPTVVAQQENSRSKLPSTLSGFTKKLKTPIATTQGGSRFVPRCFKIEILAFAWDESVQDPYRIRFNFRCKILRDMFWDVDRPSKREGAIAYGQSLGSNTSPGGSGWGGTIREVSTKPGGGGKAIDFPLNAGAQSALVARSSGGLPEQFQSLVGPALNNVLAITGLGQNSVVQKVQALGQSVFGTNQPTYGSAERGESLSWGIEENQTPTVADTNNRLGEVLQSLPSIIAPQQQSAVQVGGWSVPITPTVSQLVQGINLQDLSFF